MEFEFDPAKSASNKDKHGIDFVEARLLWRDDYGLTIMAKQVDEGRLALIAKMQEKLWLAVYTMRHGRIRIISVRRARQNERQYYEDHKLGRVRPNG